MANPTSAKDHSECCSYLEKPQPCPCRDLAGKPWRNGWQKPDNFEDDDLSKKGPATAYMLGKFSEFPSYFNDPSLSEEQKLRRVVNAKATILRILCREAERLGLEPPTEWSPEVTKPILQARIKHNNQRRRASRKHSSARPVEQDEDDGFSAFVATFERLGMQWKPSTDVEITDKVASGSL
ncbi:hypothetical protein F4810DRAFT_672831 [Camillea tinctor]|nr:hypothetical protein F4810DRAFT_672831 [Camillea tinctor]